MIKSGLYNLYLKNSLIFIERVGGVRARELTQKALGRLLQWTKRDVSHHSGGSGELLRNLANRTDDRLGAENEGQRKIKDVAKLFVLSYWVDVVAIC